MEDDEFDQQYTINTPSNPNMRAAMMAKQEAGKIKSVKNQHFDAEMEMSDVDSMMTPGPSPSAKRSGKALNMGDSPPSHSDLEEDEDESESKMMPDDTLTPPQPKVNARAAAREKSEDTPSPSHDRVSEDTGSRFDSSAAFRKQQAEIMSTMTGVSQDMKELFEYIGRYSPLDIPLETKLVPFIPDLIPAVGELDPFIKVVAPDSKCDHLGLVVWDEPAAQQSEASVLNLKLRAMSKATSVQPQTVFTIEQASKNPQKVSNWINKIAEVHREKPPATMNYSRPMPDIDFLMQAWTPEFEEALKKVGSFVQNDLPSAELDISLSNFIRVACAILDIPVHEHVTESFHLLCSLYLEFKNNQHFTGAQV